MGSAVGILRLLDTGFPGNRHVTHIYMGLSSNIWAYPVIWAYPAIQAYPALWAYPAIWAYPVIWAYPSIV